jgi:hypothetical protein
MKSTLRSHLEAGGNVANGTVEMGMMSIDLVATSGRRILRARVAQGPVVSGNGSGAVVAAGTHSDPANTVSVWNASVAADVRFSDRLLDHEEIGDGRPPLSYKVDGDVTSLEFWGGPQADGSLHLWAGTSTGHVSLLCAQRYEGETDGQGRHLEAWQVSQLATAEHRAKMPLHSLAASAFALLPASTEVLSAGEDGYVCALSCTGPAVVATQMARADSVAIYDIKMADITGQTYIVAGATGGIRRFSRHGGKPSVLAESGGCAWMTVEMVKDFYVLAGRADGELALIDTRTNRAPVAVLNKHSSNHASPHQAYHAATVNALRRGPHDDYLSCAQDGTVMRFEINESSARGSVFAVQEWRHYPTPLNDVSATAVYRGLRNEARLVVAASDTGLLMGQV